MLSRGPGGLSINRGPGLTPWPHRTELRRPRFPWPRNDLMTQPLRPPIAPVGTEPTKLFIPAPVPWYRVPVPPAPAESMPVVAKPVPPEPSFYQFIPDPPKPKRKPAPAVSTLEPAPASTVAAYARALFHHGRGIRAITTILDGIYPPAEGFSRWTPGQVRSLLREATYQGILWFRQRPPVVRVRSVKRGKRRVKKELEFSDWLRALLKAT